VKFKKRYLVLLAALPFGIPISLAVLALQAVGDWRARREHKRADLERARHLYGSPGARFSVIHGGRARRS
jgi:hypothetical protein